MSWKPVEYCLALGPRRNRRGQPPPVSMYGMHSRQNSKLPKRITTAAPTRQHDISIMAKNARSSKGSGRRHTETADGQGSGRLLQPTPPTTRRARGAKAAPVAREPARKKANFGQGGASVAPKANNVSLPRVPLVLRCYLRAIIYACYLLYTYIVPHCEFSHAGTL